MATTGERIKARRIELGKTQDEVATKANITKGFLSDVENGRRNVGADTLLDLATALSVSLDYLMTGEIVETEQKALEIPAALAEFASREGLSFRQTRQLLGMAQQIVAHRSSTAAKAA